MHCMLIGRKSIIGLAVRCANGNGKCQWVGTYGKLQTHATKCELMLLPCPNSCADDSATTKHFTRSELHEHLLACPNREYKCPQCEQTGKYSYIINDHSQVCPNRQHICPQCEETGIYSYIVNIHRQVCPNREHKCPHCEERGIYSYVTRVHDTVCRKKPIKCENLECSREVQRQGMKKHLGACQYTPVPCKFARLGCSETPKRMLVQTHENDDTLHLHMAINTITRLMEEKERVTLRSGESVTFKMTRFSELKERSETYTSPSIQTPNGHHLVLKVQPNGNSGTHVSVHVDGSGSRTGMEAGASADCGRTFNGSVTTTLLNQLGDEGHIQKNGLRNFPTFVQHAKLGLNASKNTQYLMNNELYFKVTVEEPGQKPWLESVPVLE